MNYISQLTCHYSVHLDQPSSAHQLAVSIELLALRSGEIGAPVSNLGGKEDTKDGIVGLRDLCSRVRHEVPISGPKSALHPYQINRLAREFMKLL